MSPEITHETAATANEHLDTIEDEYNVTIVLAVAHGSHAWGLSNEDSDYDIKAVYVPDDLHQYAQIGSHRETIQRDFDPYEIEAWDVNKFAELLRKSNDQAVDVLRSPIAYRERVSREKMREYIEQSYNPIQLYHTYRSIAKNNYRKYLSNHLTSNRDNTYPILERRDDAADPGYVVRNEHTGEDLFVPDRVVDCDPDDPQFIDMDYEAVDTGDQSDDYCPQCEEPPETLPTKFQTTQTLQTVKRNLAVIRVVMYALYLKRTGEGGEHELPHEEFPVFLSEQAPAYFEDDVLDLAWDLVERKRDGDNSDIGDLLGEDLAHPPQEIDHQLHARTPPEQDQINEYVSEMLAVAADN